MCRHNEHLFCRACITKHLMNSQTCPTCMEPLTLDTLTQAPRGIRNLLAELKIGCEFFERGCKMFVELGDLERHVADCGFAPAVCSNAGCQFEVNKQDLIHYASAHSSPKKIDNIYLAHDRLSVKKTPHLTIPSQNRKTIAHAAITGTIA